MKKIYFKQIFKLLKGLINAFSTQKNIINQKIKI